MIEKIKDLMKYEKIVESNYFIPHEVDEKDKKNSYLNFGNFIPEEISFKKLHGPKKNKEKENYNRIYSKEEEKIPNVNNGKTTSREKDKINENKSRFKEIEKHKQNLDTQISKEPENKKPGVDKENNLKIGDAMEAETDECNFSQAHQDNQIEDDKNQDEKDKQIKSSGKVNLKETSDKQAVTDYDNGIPNEVKFGQHKSESFYENYGREIIFQIFGYPKMSHFSYDYDVKKSKVIDKISNWANEYEKKNINLRSYLNEETGGKVIDEENKNDQELEDKQIENKVESDDIKKSNYFNIDIKTSGNESSDYDKNKEKKKSLTDNSIKKKKKKKKNDCDKFRGDFDFLIHGLDGKTLKAVIEDKKKYPFIFYGNFELKENDKFDILGEIKETLHKSQDIQAIKYIKMIYHILIEDHTNEFGQKLGFRKEHTKILMYVFNSEYYSFLLEMLSFDINLKKFKNNKEEKSEAFTKICDTFKGKTEKNKLIKAIIRSDLPFIFIFIPNILKIQYIKDKEKSELSKKVASLEEELKELQSKFENQNIESQKVINDLKLEFQNQKKASEKVIEFREALKKYGIIIISFLTMYILYKLSFFLNTMHILYKLSFF